MKIKIILSILVITIFILISCLSMKPIQNEYNSNDVFTISKSSFDFEVKIKWLEDGNYQLEQGSNQTIITYLNREFSSSNLDSIYDIEIFLYVTNDEQMITIAAIGVDRKGNSVPIAKVFEPSDENPSPQSRLYGSGGGDTDKHKCTGNPCACCSFIKETTTTMLGTISNTKIIGCECDNAAHAKCGNGTICNHTISGG